MEIGYSKPLFFFYSVLQFFATLTFAADPDLRADCIAAAGNYTANSAYQTNLNSIFYRLTSQTEFNYGFYNLSDGENPNKVNAIALCRGDRNQDECKSCLNETISELRQRCPFNKEVIGWHEYCTLRYANRDIFGDMEISPDTCLYKKINVSNVVQFFVQLDDLLSNLIIQAAAGGLLRKYATGTSSVGDSQTVYGLAQCTPDLSKQECGYCLSMAKVGIGGCCSRAIGCTALRPSCFMRFESTPFYQTQIPSTPSPTYSSPPSAGGRI